MIAENILVIVEQLSLKEQIRLYKMIGEKVKCKTRKNKIKSHQTITDEEAIEFIKKMCFSRKESMYK
jgi:hypothetical protein